MAAAPVGCGLGRSGLLRRTGRHFRIPVHADPESARRTLAAERACREHLVHAWAGAAQG